MANAESHFVCVAGGAACGSHRRIDNSDMLVEASRREPWRGILMSQTHKTPSVVCDVGHAFQQVMNGCMQLQICSHT